MKAASDHKKPPRAPQNSEPKAPQHRGRQRDGVKHMTEDSRSLVAGSGNTLGDGSTAGSTARKDNGNDGADEESSQ